MLPDSVIVTVCPFHSSAHDVEYLLLDSGYETRR